jgi:hypothetical protein
MHRRLVISSQTPGHEIKELVERMNQIALKRQFQEIKNRRDELKLLKTELELKLNRLSELYLALSLYRPEYDDDYEETQRSITARHSMRDEVLLIEDYFFSKMDIHMEPILDSDGGLIVGHTERMRDLSHEVNVYCKDLNESFVMYVKTLTTDGKQWKPVIYYNQPAPETNSKALNLNSALQFMYAIDPNVVYLETRDADDLAPQDFLGVAVGTLEDHPETSFVQSKKLTIGSGIHPLEPDEPVFFDRIMPAKNASNAVFPCGSGLVWRLSDLAEIGEFPNWNLVEDLYSGFLAWQRGKHGLYIDVVGAVGQVVPEDIPNIYKQRGTWALDTMRLFFWHSKKGLSFWQRLQFAEIGLFYLLSFPVMFLVMIPIISLLAGVHPLVTDHLQYALHFWPFAASVELFLIAMADGIPYERIWKSRQTWFGLAPVYAKACILALLYGPKRKPTYKVTRKYHQFSFYWRQTLVQWSMAFATIFAIAFHLMSKKLISEADLGSILYAVFYLFVLSGILRTSWYGMFRKPVADNPA